MKIDSGDIVGHSCHWFQMYFFSKPLSARLASVGKKITSSFGYMLIIPSLCSVINTLSYLQYEAACFFHQSVTSVEISFLHCHNLLLFLAAKYAHKSQAIEILNEHSSGHAFFPTVVLSKGDKTLVYSHSGRVTRMLRCSISAKHYSAATTTSPAISAFSIPDIYVLALLRLVQVKLR